MPCLYACFVLPWALTTAGGGSHGVRQCIGFPADGVFSLVCYLWNRMKKAASDARDTQHQKELSAYAAPLEPGPFLPEGGLD